MLLDTTTVSSDDGSRDEWGRADTEKSLALSSVYEDARLNDCIIAALAVVWGVSSCTPASLRWPWRWEFLFFLVRVFLRWDMRSKIRKRAKSELHIVELLEPPPLRTSY